MLFLYWSGVFARFARIHAARRCEDWCSFSFYEFFCGIHTFSNYNCKIRTVLKKNKWGRLIESCVCASAFRFSVVAFSQSPKICTLSLWKCKYAHICFPYRIFDFMHRKRWKLRIIFFIHRTRLNILKNISELWFNIMYTTKCYSFGKIAFPNVTLLAHIMIHNCNYVIVEFFWCNLICMYF